MSLTIKPFADGAECGVPAKLGNDLEPFSLETVQRFHGDAETAGYEL